MLRALFDDLDTDGDGRVSLHEFVTGVQHGGADRFVIKPAIPSRPPGQWQA